MTNFTRKFLLCLILAACCPAMAQAQMALAATVPAATRALMNVTVRSVTWADPAKGTKSEIVVADGFKKPIHILITSTTTLWDADAKALMPERIVPRKHVNILYLTTPEGINIGKSIKLLK